MGSLGDFCTIRKFPGLRYIAQAVIEVVGCLLSPTSNRYTNRTTRYNIYSSWKNMHRLGRRNERLVGWMTGLGATTVPAGPLVLVYSGTSKYMVAYNQMYREVRSTQVTPSGVRSYRSSSSHSHPPKNVWQRVAR